MQSSADSDEDSMPDLLEARSQSSSEASSLSDASEYRRLKQSVKVPTFGEVTPTVSTASPALLSALYCLSDDLAVRKVSVNEYYQELRVSEVTLHGDLPPRAHVDGGALATTTNACEYIWSYHQYDEEERRRVTRLRVADDTIHIPSGRGYLKVPCNETPGFLFVECYYTPEIPATILSPNALAKSFDCSKYCSFSDLIHGQATLELGDCTRCIDSVHFQLSLIRGLLYTDSLVAPTPCEHTSPSLPESSEPTNCMLPAPCVLPVNACCTSCATTQPSADIARLTNEQSRALWHMRLGHINDRTVSDIHKHVDGIPDLPRSDALHKCPMCARAKLHKAGRGASTERIADHCWQHIQIDYGFFVVKSAGRKNKVSRAQSAPTPSPIDDQPLDINNLDDSTEQGRVTTSDGRRISARVRQSSTRSSPSHAMDSGPSPVAKQPQQSKDSRPAPPPATVSPAHDDPLSPRPTFAPATSQEKYAVKKIVSHQGPLLPSDKKRYKGEPFNVKILWDTGTHTWEPLSNMLTDIPDMVAAYATEHNLLNNPAWAAVRDHVLHPPADRLNIDLDDFHPDDSDLPTSDDHELEFVPLRDDEVADKAANAAARYRRLVGLNGETCYCLITDLKSGCWKVSVRRDKSPPLDFLRSFIARHAPNCSDKSVRFDNGGELGGNTDIVNLFESVGYEVEFTAPNSSSEVGQVERPHRTIADGVRTCLFAANLEPKFWPYALINFVFIANCLPRGDRPKSAITMCTGRRVNLSHLRVFGSRVFVLPTTNRAAKVDVHGRPGVFLGFKKTMRHAYVLDDATKKVITARHIAFDEGWNESPNPPPYVRYLKGNLDTTRLHLDDVTKNMTISLSPFNKIEEVPSRFSPSIARPLGFQVERCPRYMRAYISAFTRSFGKHTKDQANRKYVGAYILQVGERPTFSPDDVTAAIRHYAGLPRPPRQLTVHLACDERAHLSDSRPPPLVLRPVDIRRVAALNLVAGEGNSPQQRRAIRAAAATPLLSATPPDPDDLIEYAPAELLEMRKLMNDHMTPEEKALPSFKRKHLQTLPNYQDWVDADRKQLDAHFDSGTIGHPVPRPQKDPLKPSQVFRLVWNRLVKATGVRKSRACLDGSKRAAPWLRMLVQTYSSCIELPCLRTFIGICVNRGYYIAFGDVDNAYQQSPPPSVDCFLEIDHEVQEWYLNRFGKKLDRLKDVIPLYRALQGHPEAGVLWERLITDILINKMGFKNTTHEKNLYTGDIDGGNVLVCRQVDDFAAGAANKTTTEKFFTILRSHVESEYHALGVETNEGIYERYNGIDIIQTRDYVKVGCETYIDRVLQSHGWDVPTKKDSDKPVPLNPNIVNDLMLLEGPPEKSVEAKQLAKDNGFSYRNVLGELIYAYVIARLDIGFAVCFLARFSERPHQEHFVALKGVCKYLRATKTWGIMYQRPFPLKDLPAVPFEFLENDPSLPSFPDIPRDQVAAALDAAHATDLKTRRSVTGLIAFYCCAAVAWKSRLQPICATSSTEAEFYAAVTAAKLVKYLRYVVQELDAMRPGPSPLFIDNQAALAMINESRPTPRARHIETQHFAIQEWAQRDIYMKHLEGIMNCSDGLTKPLSWVLFSRHARRGMGHYKLGSP